MRLITRVYGISETRAAGNLPAFHSTITVSRQNESAVYAASTRITSGLLRVAMYICCPSKWRPSNSCSMHVTYDDVNDKLSKHLLADVRVHVGIINTLTLVLSVRPSVCNGCDVG